MNFVKTEFTDKVLSHFDKATYLDEGVFLDRFVCEDNIKSREFKLVSSIYDSDDIVFTGSNGKLRAWI